MMDAPIPIGPLSTYAATSALEDDQVMDQFNQRRYSRSVSRTSEQLAKKTKKIWRAHVDGQFIRETSWSTGSRQGVLVHRSSASG